MTGPRASDLQGQRCQSSGRSQAVLPEKRNGTTQDENKLGREIIDAARMSQYTLRIKFKIPFCCPYPGISQRNKPKALLSA